VNREYAEKFGDHWLILSAKHGFIEPEFMIPADYNVTFKDATSGHIPVKELRAQVAAKGLTDFARVVVLGGSAYARVAQEVFARPVVCPSAGLPIGKAMGLIRAAIDKNTPF
jgi:hypothetical protein